TRGEIGLKGIDHRQGVIFGMAAGDDATIILEKLSAFGIDAVIGDDVIFLASRFEPVDDMEIGIEVPDRPLRPGVQDRAAGRAVTGTAAIEMIIIERDTEIAPLAQEEFGRTQFKKSPIGRLGERVLPAMMTVGISEERISRGEEGDRRRCRPARRQDEERDMVFLLWRVTAFNMQSINAAAQIRGHLPADVALPTGVIKVVAVEMNGAIECRLVAPAGGLALPVMPADRT